jgi:Fe-S cluster assembly protein SufD
MANRAAGIVEGLDGATAQDDHSMVFVDGLFAPTLSRNLPADGPVRLDSLAHALSVTADRLEPWFESFDGDAGERSGLDYLNAAAFRDGASIVVEPTAHVRGVIRLRFVATSSRQAIAAHVRSHVHLSEGARARIEVVISGSDDARGLINSRLLVSLGRGARLELLRIHESPRSVPHFDSLQAHVGEEAFLADTVLQAATWARTEVRVALSGAGAAAELKGALLAGRSQISDIHTTVDHDAPRCRSRQSYRGVAAGDGRGVFHGRVRVAPSGGGADAEQSNKNLLLSRGAFVHSTPVLEILADDVKCRHGSTTGQLDPAQTFYLRSRGVDETAARRLLARAFVSGQFDNTGGTVGSALDRGLAQLGLAA